jgi:cytochrome P450
VDRAFAARHDGCVTAEPETRFEAAAPQLADPATYAAAVPHEEFARLRREDPVSWVEERPLWRSGASGRRTAVAGPGYWAVTRYADVVRASRSPEVFSSGQRGAFLADPKTRQDLERTRRLLVNMDAPEHSRIRRRVALAFTPRMVERLRSGIRTHAVSLVRAVSGRERFDAVADLAAELPVLAIADLLGVPREDRGLLLRWSGSLVGFDDPEVGAGQIEVYKRTFEEAFAYARRLAEARRRRPADDLVSRLVTQEDGLGEQELCHFWFLIVVAGNETTRHLLSGGLHALASFPAERDRLVASPELIPGAVEELLRWVSPVMQFRRTATREAELGGRRIREGDKVVLYYVSANRDEEVFDEPQRLDVGRRGSPHVAFGVGPHFCLGAHLARLEAAALLEALGPDLARFELAGPPARLASNFVNGFRSMPARIRPAQTGNGRG